MLFPKCPRCGGKSESAEGNAVFHGNRQLKQFAHGSMTGHAHPLLGLAATAISIGNFAWQRLPGCGRKRCTACGHEFN